MAFKKAERKKAKLRLAICGPSGAGKTFSAVMLAKGLGGRVAMIDTERGSGELYAHLCDYDVCQVDAPFTTDKYIDAIREAESLGYEVIIVDSLSHAWAAEGGLLDQVDKKTSVSRSGNSYTAWRDVTPKHNALVDAMLQSSSHIIATMRTKVAYDLQKNEQGRMTPIKVGLAPVQREGMDYEFTVVFDVTVERHLATASKDRTSLFDGKVFLINAETGQTLKTWLNEGLDQPAMAHETPAPTRQANAQGVTEKQRKAMFAAINEKLPYLKGDREALLDTLSATFGRLISSSSELTPGEVSSIIEDPGLLVEYAPTAKEYQAMLERKKQNAAAVASAVATAAPWDEQPTMPDPDEIKNRPICRRSLDLINKELSRLGVPDQLPPDLADRFGTTDPSALTELNGQDALQELRKIKF